MTTPERADRLGFLVEEGLLPAAGLAAAVREAAAGDGDLEGVLVRRHGVPREALARGLARSYGCEPIAYDERLPVPPELLAGLDASRLGARLWFPVIRDGAAVIVAANDPADPRVREEAAAALGTDEIVLRFALAADVRWFIQDLLHAPPRGLIGQERTGLAFWRNTMAHWRTRLACYRTDLARARTALAALRWGLGLVALSTVLARTRPGAGGALAGAALLAAVGVALAAWSATLYAGVRRSRMRPPREQTLVEVTAAALSFAERYHLREGAVPRRTRETMLTRLGDSLPAYCTLHDPQPPSRARTELARERNLLAAERTLAACYRTIYARARTGLAFIRTGVSFVGLGLGLLRFFPPGLPSLLDALLLLAGVAMTVDGVRWYWPVRAETGGVFRGASL